MWEICLSQKKTNDVTTQAENKKNKHPMYNTYWKQYSAWSILSGHTRKCSHTASHVSTVVGGVNQSQGRIRPMDDIVVIFHTSPVCVNVAFVFPIPPGLCYGAWTKLQLYYSPKSVLPWKGRVTLQILIRDLTHFSWLFVFFTAVTVEGDTRAFWDTLSPLCWCWQRQNILLW